MFCIDEIVIYDDGDCSEKSKQSNLDHTSKENMVFRH